ncbi:hypothetical protein COU59_02745 [Candidatus Pacearchaeota archaeon CG10_big_fil_rev_8_21_14_0_10_34_12]|nr:MAG: hypothetical protein COU59_02745 [Candidatus Pacearchaeota archaeon CG10_big_fil_rev_8_21_14_0_10_34_12]
MLSNKKHVFWEAFFLAVLFILVGLVLGIWLEQLRSDNTNISFYQSETSLYDSFALGKLIENPYISCEDLKMANVNFADQIYDEARYLEKYEDSSKLTDSLKIIHRKYDLLRTLLWMNVINMEAKCGEINTVVYLYNYSSDKVKIKSKQTVWSRTLQDLKEEEGNTLILIPIAVDQNIVSLNYLLKTYGVKNFPAVLINEKEVLYDIHSTEEIKDYLK